MSNIYDALKKVDFRFAEYFKYLHPELRFNHDKPLKTEEDFLRLVNRKSMSAFYRWEKSSEYKNLLMLYLDYRISNDYEEIYNVVTDKAKQGDDKAVRLFLQLQKEINSNAKEVSKVFDNVEDAEKENDTEFDLS